MYLNFMNNRGGGKGSIFCHSILGLGIRQKLEKNVLN